MTSRRAKQEIRRAQRSAGRGARYNNHRRGGRGGVTRSPGGGWPENSRDTAVAAAISEVRHLVGNSMPARTIPGVCEALGIDEQDAPAEIMVSAVAPAPDPDFPYIESARLDEYDYGLVLDEVSLGFDADIELVALPRAAAEDLIRSGHAVLVLDEDPDVVDVRVEALPFVFTGQTRTEAEQSEMLESWITVRRDDL